MLEVAPTPSGQHPAIILMIAKFDEIFIKADSRKIMQRNRPLAWVSHPTEFTSRGYNELLDSHDSVTGMAIYGVFMQLVKLSVQSAPYGVLQHSDGAPFNPGYISRTIGVDRELVKQSIDVLRQIRWVVPFIPTASGCHPDTVGTLSGLQTDRQTLQTDKVRCASPSKNGAKQKRQTAPKEIIPPSLEDVQAYCQERGNGIDPQHFINHYEANGWMRGKSKLKSWKACIRTWEGNRPDNTASTAKAEFEKLQASKLKWPEDRIDIQTEFSEPAIKAANFIGWVFTPDKFTTFAEKFREVS